jgi:hypothetical protein
MHLKNVGNLQKLIFFYYAIPLRSKEKKSNKKYRVTNILQNYFCLFFSLVLCLHYNYNFTIKFK